MTVAKRRYPQAGAALIQVNGAVPGTWPAHGHATRPRDDAGPPAGDVFLAVRMIARRSLRSGAPPDFDQLRRLVAYVERFSQKLHQAAEEQQLFRAVERRAPAAASARAKRDHAACLGYQHRLNNALGRWIGGQASAGGEVALMADDYVRFCRLHSRIEARECCRWRSRCSGRTTGGRSGRPMRPSTTRWQARSAAATAPRRCSARRSRSKPWTNSEG